jgi:hypothetical protein
MQELVAIEMHIKQGDAFAGKAAEYEEKATFNRKKADDCRISAGKSYIAAKLDTENQGLKWTHQLKAYGTRTRGDVAKCIKIASAADPHAALEEERAERAAGMRNHREKSEDVSHGANVGYNSRHEGVEFSDVVYLRRSETILDFTKDPDTRPAPSDEIFEERDWGAEIRRRDARIEELLARIAELEKELGDVELERDELAGRIEDLMQAGFK